MNCPRCGSNSATPFYSHGWMIDPVRAVVAFKGPAVPITATWARMLVTLACEQGGLVSHADLMAVARCRSRNSIKSQIGQLRRFLASHGLPDPIGTVWGRGYRWAARSAEKMAS